MIVLNGRTVCGFGVSTFRFLNMASFKHSCLDLANVDHHFTLVLLLYI